MNTSYFKTAELLFPFEDSIREIAFKKSDIEAMDVLMELVLQNNCELFGLAGFSVDDMAFFDRSLSKDKKTAAKLFH